LCAISTLSGVCVLYVLIVALDGVSWVQGGSVEIAVGTGEVLKGSSGSIPLKKSGLK